MPVAAVLNAIPIVMIYLTPMLRPRVNRRGKLIIFMRGGGGTCHSLAPGRAKGSRLQRTAPHACRPRKTQRKLWLDPDVRIAENLGYGRQELRELERIARQHIELLRREWDEFCGSDPDAN